MSVASAEGATPELIVGDSEVIRSLRARVALLAPLDLPVLIEGPTGSGKELVAQALHESSGRAGRFVAFNVCALSETMFEDALFGHARGAFTGALSDRDGYFAEADGGTLFLDEIGGLPLAAQAKLLRVLETHEFRPLGARRDRRSLCRVVAATNDDIAALVRAGRVRADFYHRLRGALVRVPALSARRGDLGVLARHFAAAAHAAAGVPPVQVSACALSALSQHDWNGNVRELRHVIEYAMALSADGTLRGEAVRYVLRELSEGVTARELADGAPALDGEREVLRALLELHGWDVEAAARESRVSRASLYRRMERYGLHRPPGTAKRKRLGRPAYPFSLGGENSHAVSETR